MCGIILMLRQRIRKMPKTEAPSLRTQMGATPLADERESVTPSEFSSSMTCLNCSPQCGVSAPSLHNLTNYAVLPCRYKDATLCRASSPTGDTPSSNDKLFTQITENIKRRGPEGFYSVSRVLEACSTCGDGGESAAGLVSSTVVGAASMLGLRGREPVRQPYEIVVETDMEDEQEARQNKCFLLWNGEIFGGSMCPPPWGSDTILLASRLSQLERECVASAGKHIAADELRKRQQLFLSRCVEVLESEVEGPFGLIFYASQLQLVVFGRDPLGRHSLLTHLTVNARSDGNDLGHMDVEFIVSSVGVRHTANVYGEGATNQPFANGGGVDVAVSESDAACSARKTHQASKRTRQCQEDEDENADEGPDEHTCWSELPITGLFGLPFDAPFFRNTSLEFGGPISAMTGWLMHCPWQSCRHRIHPLLRAVELSCRDVTLPQPVVTIGEEFPPLPSTLAQKVQQWLQSQVPAQQLSEEDKWAQTSALRYLHALTAAVSKCITLSNSGADDSNDAEKLLKARTRPVCVLFSGGIDCTVLAALSHYLLPLDTPIELINVAFGDAPEQAPDRISALRAMEELLLLPQPTENTDMTCETTEREWRLVLVDVPEKFSDHTSHILDLLTPRSTVMDLDIGTAVWYAARGLGRMQRLYKRDVARLAPVYGTASGMPDDFCKHFRVRVDMEGARKAASGNDIPPQPLEVGNEDKFDVLVQVLVTEGRASGGPDTPVLLSTLGKEYGSFLQPHLRRYGYKKLGPYMNDASHAGVVLFATDTPSKAVRLARLEDRQRAAPVPLPHWFPTSTMLEGCSGVASTPRHGTYTLRYQSTAKVMLLGMGADETLGGYTRYRRFFNRHGMSGARAELAKDFTRLWERNLGRDDRITSDSGREARLPYMDEQVLRTLEAIVTKYRHHIIARLPTPRSSSAGSGVHSQCPSSEEDDALLQLIIDPVVSFHLGAGEGDKRILRTVASCIGLTSVARLQKRAIQFGTRVADRKIRGSTPLILS